MSLGLELGLLGLWDDWVRVYSYIQGADVRGGNFRGTG